MIIIDPQILHTLYESLPDTTKELLLNPSATAIGKGLGSAFAVVFSPITALGTVVEGKLNDLIAKTQSKARKIPSEYQDFSKPGLLLKAIEESRYSLDEEMLRDMFANLIVSGLDKRKNSKLTPRYATILSQIGLDEAKLLQLIYSQKSKQLLTGKVIAVKRLPNHYRVESYRVLSDNYAYCDNQEILHISEVSLNMLSSLGVISYDGGPTATENVPTVLRDYLENIDDFNAKLMESETIELIPGQICPTSLGLTLFSYIF